MAQLSRGRQRRRTNRRRHSLFITHSSRRGGWVGSVIGLGRPVLVKDGILNVRVERVALRNHQLDVVAEALPVAACRCVNGSGVKVWRSRASANAAQPWKLSGLPVQEALLDNLPPAGRVQK